MKEKGSQFERTIRLIQEAFKDSVTTQILSNYKIPNESGNNREIDILIISKVNDFEIYIAIECKDYSKKIPVEKIEAFQSKCDRIKQINKKIFISSNGFQSDAINSARYYGIELLTATELSRDYLENILPIRQLKPEILPIINNSILHFDSSEDNLKEIQKIFKGEIYNEIDNSVTNINIILNDAIIKYRREIFGLALFEWMKMDNKNNEEITFPVNFGLQFSNSYILGLNNEHITLLNGTFDVLVKFGFIYPQMISGRTLKDKNGIVKANTINVKIEDNLESEMIIRDDEVSEFYVTENKQTRKLETLFIYNPKTNKITKPKK
ncbi:restriction endonuclease [Flavobacterium sp. 1]|uniref:restriction endonuclease n=1 Tax=Flavobacterium sp. 1 TaxID=2035200 RepID=UPI000C2384BA|nr:restriction endonuclease [Flavobacterium sp. 1]PJJ09827.1 restriction endonuclease [Flavobacterium sp. 1]